MSVSEHLDGSVAPATNPTPTTRRFSDGGEIADAPPNGRIPWGMLVGLPMALIGMVFAPLVASLVEGMLFKTRRVEEFFEHVGLHDALSAIYSPVAMWFFSLTGMRP
jgi:hypothetical protein